MTKPTIRGLRDVNNVWLETVFLISTTKMTVGVNFVKIYYDRVYLFIAGLNSTRRSIQVRRCRSLNDRYIRCAFLNKYNTHQLQRRSLSCVSTNGLALGSIPLVPGSSGTRWTPVYSCHLVSNAMDSNTLGKCGKITLYERESQRNPDVTDAGL